jgi:hypothetical protein
VKLAPNRQGHINCSDGSVLFYRRINVVAAMLSLTLICGCAHTRKASSGQNVPRSPLRGNAEVSNRRGAAHRAEDNINDVLSRLERTAQPTQRPAETADRPVSQIGTGTGDSERTTGIVPESFPSGASSSVVVTQPRGTPGGNASSATAASSKPGLADATGATIVGFVVVACCLIAVIVWLPRRLNAR